MPADVLDTIRGVGWIAQVQYDDGTWVSWTQYANGTPEANRDNARTHVERLLERQPHLVRGRVVRADWVVEEVLTAATDPDAPQEEA